MSRDSQRGEQRQPLSLNRYAYAVNSSVNYTDHSGEAPTSFAWTGETSAPPFPLYFDYLQLEPKTRVKLVQRLLDRMGYEVVVDGIHGNQTDRALEDFAKDYGLPVVIAENFVAYSHEKTKKAYGHVTYRRAVVTEDMYRSLTCAYTDRYYRRIGFVTNPDRVSIPERVSFPRSETVGAMKVTGGYVWPTINVPIVITHPYHQRDKGYCCIHTKETGHEGVDIGGYLMRGSPIYAIKDGYAQTVDKVYSYDGISAAINHSTDDPPTARSRYLHLDATFLEQSQDVVQGQIIGVLGSTGYSFGPHLHFELYLEGKRQDPLLQLELPEGSTLKSYVPSPNPNADCPPTG